MSSNHKLKSISMPELKHVGGYAQFGGNSLLTALDLQRLVVVAASFSIFENPLLTTNGVQVSKDFLGCGSQFTAGYNSGTSGVYPLSGLECTVDNGLKAVVAAAKATSPANPQSCQK